MASGDFPGGSVVKTPPSNARDARLIPGWGAKIPHATGHLSLCTTTREALCCNEDPAQPKFLKLKKLKCY